MKIRCWGARGSIPVSGPGYLKYGGDTTCLELTSASGDTVIVDCGSGIRRLGNRLAQDRIQRL
ncbi:MAG: MBL fold metallo-hydrolase, partial [Elusimicrobiota bacterium]